MEPDTLRDTLEEAREAERLGSWEAAEEAYRRLFRTACRLRRLPAVVDALRGGARIRRIQGEWELAEELADLSREIAERNGLDEAAARAVNVLALIRHSRQDWPGARRLFMEALELARDAGDDELIGLACQNAGVASYLLGDLREARTLYLESIGSFVRSRNAESATLAYNNLGLVCCDLAEWMEAEVYFGRGIEIAERLGRSPLLPRLYANRAEPLARVGELGRARESLDRAESVARDMEDRGALVDVERLRGVAALSGGDLRLAGEHLERSLAMADATGMELERAQVLREIGNLRRAEGRLDEARSVYRDARREFASLGASFDVTRVDGLMEALDGIRARREEA